MMLSINAMPAVFGRHPALPAPAMFDPIYRQVYSARWQSENRRTSRQGHVRGFLILY